MDTPTNDGRDNAGRFAQGNSGGPGRPRRVVELDYLAALGDALTLADWAAIVARAVTDAKAGDAKARDWVGRYALGSNPMGLFDLARREALGVTAGDEIDTMNAEESYPPFARRSVPVFITAAEDKADQAKAEQERIEDERKRAERAEKRAARMQQTQQAETSTTNPE